MKIATIVGARPQFIKAATVSRVLRDHSGVNESLIHTGQHYDRQMSDVFFEELDIPAPTHHLGVGSGKHGDQTGRMLIALEPALQEIDPDVVLLYGDTNSTLAGALAAAKLHLPIAHVESGLRSFNRRMPEEVNRVVTDQLSSLLFCPTRDAVANLAAEGIVDEVYCVGDVMYDGAMWFAASEDGGANALQEHGLEPGGYALLTCHRAENTDDPDRFAAIREAITTLAARTTVAMPVHPRTRCLLGGLLDSPPPGFRPLPPLAYRAMVALTRHADIVVTDSGGLQKEAFFFGVPCVTMRGETEWIETVECGANVLAAADAERIVAAYESQRLRRGSLPAAGPYYGNGLASESVAAKLIESNHHTGSGTGEDLGLQSLCDAAGR